MSMTETKSRKRTRLNAKLYAMALQEMADGPTTRQELIEQTGLSVKTVAAIVKALHQRRLIHVGAWEKDAAGRCILPAFSFGKGKDVPRPARKTGAELARAKKARKAYRLALHASAGGAFAGLVA
jgi:hypothetical protein